MSLWWNSERGPASGVLEVIVVQQWYVTHMRSSKQDTAEQATGVMMDASEGG